MYHIYYSDLPYLPYRFTRFTIALVPRRERVPVRERRLQCQWRQLQWRQLQWRQLQWRQLR